MRDLIDPEDGENRAVRAFLMHYGAAGLSVGQMKTNLRMSGWNGCWPAWCDEPGEDKQHLTKAGAQLWLRHLFALESTAGVAPSRAVNPPEFQEATWGVDSVMRPCKSMAISEYAFRQWAKDVGIVLADGVPGTFNDQQEQPR